MLSQCHFLAILTEGEMKAVSLQASFDHKYEGRATRGSNNQTFYFETTLVSDICTHYYF